MNKLSAYLKSLERARILVLGDLILDHYIWGKVDRVSPEAPVPVVRVTKENFMPGGCANVALNIRALGGRAALCGLAGKDVYGKMLVGALQKEGIDTDGIVADDERPTTLKTRVIAQHQHVVRVDREEIKPPGRKAQEQILKFLNSRLNDFDVIIISDYAKGFITGRLVDALKSGLKNKKSYIIADPKVKNMSLYKGFYLVTPNRKEAVEAAGLSDVEDEAGIIRAGRKIMKNLSLKNLLITRGEEGMSLFSGKEYINIPTFAQEVFDVSGAGDTVIATVAAGLGSGLDLVRSCILSNIAASVVVGKMGTATATKTEIEKKWETLNHGIKKELERYL